MKAEKNITFPWGELLSWYEKNGRHHLPWRQYDSEQIADSGKQQGGSNKYGGGNSEKGMGKKYLNAQCSIIDAHLLYRVWLAEILLQQTQVDRVIPYFERILERYPTIHDLARASYEEFFPYYQGMGYYSRARNILRTAKVVSEEYEGVFPRDKKLLQKLPGVGGYTSSAILAFGYGEPHLAWDTNLEKVFSRFLHGTRYQKLTDEEKNMIEEDFRKYVSKRGIQGDGGSGVETVGVEKKNSNSGAERGGASFLTTETFDTFGYKSMESDSLASSSSPGMKEKKEGQEQKKIVRAINNALMDFAATVDLKNPENIDWESYPIHSGVWYETRGSLEPREEKKSITFPIPDATFIVILHQDHKVYFSARTHLTPQSPLLQRGEVAPKTPSPLGEGRGEVYSPFFLPPALHRDTRQYVQEYFREKYGLELSVRPVHAKWITEDGRPYIAVNAQIQAGSDDQFSKHDKKSAQEVLKKLIP